MMSAAPVADFSLGGMDEQPLQLPVQRVATTFSGPDSSTGLDVVRQTYGLTGAGQTVAVIDTGIAYDHYALGGGFGVSHRVVGGWDFTEENDADPYDDGPAGFHGTHVAGIIGSTDSVYPGVSPGADLVALRVFNDAGLGYFRWVERALRWVHAHRNDFENPITTVNLSLGADWNAASPPRWATLEDELAELKHDGLLISVAAGNNFAAYGAAGLGYPAASPSVVPVASTTNAGTLSAFSQRNPRVIAAPGQSITSTVPDYLFDFNGVTDDFATASGTSMAAPYLAGASVLLREAMDLAGYPTINEDTLYTHLRQTADSVYDPATRATYRRLNLARAIETVIPPDDFGSTAATAYQLGELTESATLAGMIGRTDDTDYFTFTAGRSGTVTLTSRSTHELQARWQRAGDSPGNDKDGQLRFEVVAGQTYTVDVATGAGIGRYQAHLQLDVPQIDLGAVQDWRSPGLDLADGPAHYQLTAARTGVLTVDVTATRPTQGLDLQLHGLAGPVPPGNASDPGHRRMDVPVLAGQTLQLSILGDRGTVDVRIVNLVARQGDRLDVFGTDGPDTFSFSALAARQVTVNGISYALDEEGPARVRFHGQGTGDSIVLTGSDGDDTTEAGLGWVHFSGRGYQVDAEGMETIHVSAGNGHNVAQLHDGPGDDWLVVSPNRVTLSGAGYHSRLDGFQRVGAVAIAGGTDRAYLHDSAGDDYFVSKPGLARLSGLAYCHSVRGFDRVYALGSTGVDRAYLYDSEGDDNLVGRAEYTQLGGATYVSQARGFDRVYAYADAGGLDRAFLFGSRGQDSFAGRPEYGRLAGADYYNYAQGFDRVYAYADAGGQDRAYLYDSDRSDRFTGKAEQGWMSGPGYYNQARGFARLYVYAHAGDRAQLQGSGQNDTLWLSADGRTTTFSSERSFIRAEGFSRITADGGGGGADRAMLPQAKTGDTVYGQDDYVAFASGQVRASAERFDIVTAAAALGETPKADVRAVDFVLQIQGDWI